MCERAVENESENLEFVPDHLKTQDMCERAVEKCPCNLRHAPDYLRTQEMCNEAVQKRLCLFESLPDIYGMMTLIIAIMMNLLSSTMVIKNGRPGRQK